MSNAFARHVACLVCAVTLFATLGCQPDVVAPSPIADLPVAAHTTRSIDGEPRALDAVMSSNAQVINSAPFLVPLGVPLAPFVEARLYAMANIAMHDALNTISPRYERYALTTSVSPGANPSAAVLTAARDVIIDAAPTALTFVDAWYTAEMSQLANAPGVNDGVTIGQRAAAAIIARRAGDGTAGGAVGPYVPGSNAGDYQFTFPFNTPAFNFFGTGGFADATRWGATVTPFAVTSSRQFRVGAPYGTSTNASAVQTARYTRDFDEVASLGCATCAARSAEQSTIAQFWVENSPTAWNRIARTIVAQRRLSAGESARVFALLHIAEFDAYLTTLESKYHYNFWRPVTAIERAAHDGNPATSPVPGWQVVAFPTPPVPDYPSAHASAGGGAMAILESIVPRGPKHFSTTSGSLIGVTRHFASVESAAWENALSRIYVGFHFREAVTAGMQQGRAVGSYVVETVLQPARKQ